LKADPPISNKSTVRVLPPPPPPLLYVPGNRSTDRFAAQEAREDARRRPRADAPRGSDDEGYILPARSFRLVDTASWNA
jgi:hypothetical protein